MYLLAHILAGIITGILLTFLFRDPRLIPACVLGSVLPDLIDKPLGILLFSGSIGYGRIYAHSLFFLSLIILMGILVYTKYPRTGLLIFGLAAGIFSHHILDAMWLHTVSWLGPALGPFADQRSRPDFFLHIFWSEVTNPTEWLAGGFILAFMIVYFIPRLRVRYLSGSIESGQRSFSLLFMLLIIGMAALAIMIGISYE